MSDPEALIRSFLIGATIRSARARCGDEPAVRLSSNESPLPPFPEVQDAILKAMGELNRYPDIGCHALNEAVAEHLGVAPERILIGGGSTALIRVAAAQFGGPGTSVIYGSPSFAMYTIAAAMAGSRTIEVPLDAQARLDLLALSERVEPDTTLVYICNPNNPTGTCVGADALLAFLERIPSRVLVVVDEAYHDYAKESDPSYTSALSYGARPGLVVLRTFSKVYALAGLRIGYAVGDPAVLERLRFGQARDTLSNLAQVAALEALRHPDQVAGRVRENASEREAMYRMLDARGLAYVPSQANFVYFRLGGHDSAATAAAFADRGVWLRPGEPGWLRVSIGGLADRDAFEQSLDAVIATLSTAP